METPCPPKRRSSDAPLFVGLDIGSSGARALVIDEAGESRAFAKVAMAAFGANPRAPNVWRAAAFHALDLALAQVPAEQVVAFAVDGTSGTMLALDAAGDPLGDGLLYNDSAADAVALARIAAAAPAASGAHGATSGLAKAFDLLARGPACIAHQADWIASLFCGRLVSDANNALKTGYDPVAGAWPDWIAGVGFPTQMLPEVVAPGTALGRVTRQAAARFRLNPDALVVAGTTDGCASFLATGASQTGEGVTALGTTLALKQLVDRPIFAPKFGVYSHKILGRWLVGGASNSGGGVLLAFFSASEIEALTLRLTPDTSTGLDYYPLVRPGERFPLADPALPPRVTPRPDDPARFLQGLLEGIASVEALAYRRLQDLGAPRLQSVRSIGGGARNPAWTQIRARRLGVPLLPAIHEDAAYGAALLARAGAPQPSL